MQTKCSRSLQSSCSEALIAEESSLLSTRIMLPTAFLLHHLSRLVGIEQLYFLSHELTLFRDDSDELHGDHAGDLIAWMCNFCSVGENKCLISTRQESKHKNQLEPVRLSDPEIFLDDIDNFLHSLRVFISHHAPCGPRGCKSYLGWATRRVITTLDAQ